jgi:heme a synthase
VTPRLAKFAWLVLACIVSVIVWGAFVRATGSGAGCGSHWPLCNGAIVPRAPNVQTLIEFSHRLTSGIALLLVVGLVVWTWRATPPRHPARWAAVASLVFMLGEAAIGAGLVLFELVADNASFARAMFMVAHLVNTFLLLAVVTLTAHFLSAWGPASESIRSRGQIVRRALWTAGALGLLLAAASGAVAALGDTLFPSHSHVEALSASLSPASHVLIRLRVLHPVIAVIVGVLVGWSAARLNEDLIGRRGRLAARIVAFAAFAQLGVGALNVTLLAPVWLQLVHLLIADALWIAFVVLGAELVAERVPRAVSAAERGPAFAAEGGGGAPVPAATGDSPPRDFR